MTQILLLSTTRCRRRRLVGIDQSRVGIHADEQFRGASSADATKRGAASRLVLNNRIWVIGGAGYHPLQTDDVSIAANVPHRTVNTVEVFDPATGMWETKAPMLVPRKPPCGPGSSTERST